MIKYSYIKSGVYKRIDVNMTMSMKDEILKRILASNGEAVSGQELADSLGVSRTAVWKHMQTLQEEGYTFETIKKKAMY